MSETKSDSRRAWEELVSRACPIVNEDWPPREVYLDDYIHANQRHRYVLAKSVEGSFLDEIAGLKEQVRALRSKWDLEKSAREIIQCQRDSFEASSKHNKAGWDASRQEAVALNADVGRLKIQLKERDTAVDNAAKRIEELQSNIQRQAKTICELQHPLMTTHSVYAKRLMVQNHSGCYHAFDKPRSIELTF